MPKLIKYMVYLNYSVHVSMNLQIHVLIFKSVIAMFGIVPIKLAHDDRQRRIS